MNTVCRRLSTSIALTALVVVSVSACKKPGAAAGGDAGPGVEVIAKGAAPGAAAPPCAEDNSKQTNGGKLTSCRLTKEYTLNGFTCDNGKMLELYPDGSLKGCYLATAKVVEGFSCKDALALYTSGKLKRCKVTADKMAGDIEVKNGNWVTLYDGGGIKRLEIGTGGTKIQGVTCKGYLNYFHENGKLKKCELAEDAVIEGKKVPAKGDAGSVYVCFDNGGKRLANCNLLTGMSMD